MNYKLIIFLFTSFLFITCSDNEFNQENENMEIENYIRDNNLSATKTASGLYYIVNREGDGTHPTMSDTVTVHYRGYLLNGNEFDSSYRRNAPATFPLSAVILGWQEGIPYFSRGGAGKLIIPSALGYGGNSLPGIPSYSTLVFDVELIAINGQ